MKTTITHTTTRKTNIISTRPRIWAISVIFVASLLMALQAKPANAVLVDGQVLGFAEGYTQGFNLSFNLENIATVVTGGKLFIKDTGTSVAVGLIAPLTINDNTFGANKSSNWGAQVHTLLGSGGQSLEGSDKWEMNPFVLAMGANLEIKLDYINELSGGGFDAPIERFKQGSNLDQSKLATATSLDYNINVLGFMDTLDSPATSDGLHNFNAPWQNYIPEIMYEFELQKDAFSGDFSVAAFIANLGILHMSPNLEKVNGAGNKVYPIIGTALTPPGGGVPTSVPEPGTFALLGLGLLGMGVIRRRQRTV